MTLVIALPKEVVDLVHDKLEVLDRARFNCALPRDLRRNTDRDRALAAIARGCKKRIFNRMSPSVARFLEEARSSDGATVRGILASRPRAVLEGSRLEELKTCTVEEFEAGALKSDPRVGTRVNLYIIMLFNPALFDHIASRRLHDLAPVRADLVMLTCTSLLSALKHFDLTAPELVRLYERRVEIMCEGVYPYPDARAVEAVETLLLRKLHGAAGVVEQTTQPRQTRDDVSTA